MPGFVYASNELHGQERVSSQLEEVVMDAHASRPNT